jgi:hypothetical protein
MIDVFKVGYKLRLFITPESVRKKALYTLVVITKVVFACHENNSRYIIIRCELYLVRTHFLESIMYYCVCN